MINQRLVELRNNLKLSQRAFCKKIGLHQATYALLEKPENEIREVYIKIICQVYNVSEEWLRNGTGEIFEQEPDRQLEELLSIYDNLAEPLQEYLYKQAQELQTLQGKMNPKTDK
jgi:transcriptional regulator with XRE-family HTH domain